MKRSIYLLFFLSCLLVGNENASAETTTSLSQEGITWTFSAPVEYGKFVNNDYFIVDKGEGVEIINISPGYINIDGRDINGSMVNPAPSSYQGYDSARDYKSILNDGMRITSSTPLVLHANQSLVSTISNVPYLGGNSSYLKTAAVLTCLPSVPPQGAFRPGYSGTIKILYNKNSLNYSLLRKLKPPLTTPSFSDAEVSLKRVWLDHIKNYLNNYLHPLENMPNYGADMATDIGVVGLMLNLNYPDSQKEPLLLEYVQIGIDFYSIVKAGGKDNWMNNGGHNNGRKWPILFAGLMLNDADMKNIGNKSGDYLYSEGYGPANPPPDYIHFGEDDQTFYVSQRDVDLTSGASWNPDLRSDFDRHISTAYPYTSSMFGMPEWAIRHADYPDQSNSAWYATYRLCCTGATWSGFILSAKIMNAKSLWNHNALFDYQDRYMAITQGKTDPFGFTVVGEAPGWSYRGTSFINNCNGKFLVDMWNQYNGVPFIDSINMLK